MLIIQQGIFQHGGVLVNQNNQIIRFWATIYHAKNKNEAQPRP